VRLWLLIGLAVVVLGAAVLFGLGSRETSEEVDRNTTALVALCALRDDLDRRILQSQMFLRDYPKGIGGITPAVIRQSLNNSIRTRQSLNILDCEEAP
jgi:hypothetical protein